MKRYFIANFSSSSGRCIKLWNKIENHLKDNNIEYELLITKKKYDAAEYAFKITAENTNEPYAIIVFGGDGTLNEVVNGIASFDHLMLGYIPSGSGNDFARGMKIRFDINKSMDTIVNPILFEEINYGISEYNGTSRRFLVSSGVGYDAFVCENVNSSKIKTFLNRIYLGKLAYIIHGILQMVNLRCISADITMTSGQKMHIDKLIFMSSHILPYEGGGFKFCPDAGGMDGYLNFCVAGNISKFKVLLALPTAIFGKHVNFKGVDIYRCEKAEIYCSKKTSIHTDGETMAHTGNVSFSCGPEKIKFIMY